MVDPTPPLSGRGPEYNPKSPIQTVQIISFALMQGVLIFTAIAVFITFTSDTPPVDSLLPIPIIATVVAAVATVARFVIPSLVTNGRLRAMRQSVARDDDKAIQSGAYAIYQTRTIIEDALLEGASFFVLVAFLVSKQWWLLGIVGALMAIMAAYFPTKGRIENFINEQKQQLAFEVEQ